MTKIRWPDPPDRRGWHPVLLLSATGVTAFCAAFVAGSLLLAAFGLSPGSLTSAAGFGPGTDALAEVSAFLLAPEPAFAKGPWSDDPQTAAEVQKSLVGFQRLWWSYYSPWPIVINNVMTTMVFTLFFPWLGIAIYTRPSLHRTDRARRQCLPVALVAAPLAAVGMLFFRAGLWASEESFRGRPSVAALLPHGIPEVTAIILCAALPVHYYLRHVRGGSAVRYSAYSLRHGGTYAAAGALLVLAAFIEAGRLKFQ